MLQEGVRIPAEDGPQAGVSSLQRTDPGLGLCQDQGLRRNLGGLGRFLGGNEGVGSQWLRFLTEAQARHRPQQRVRDTRARRGLRREKMWH